MIELTSNSNTGTPPRLTVIGLGSAGGNILDRLVLDGLPGAELIAMNTDTQALSGSVAPRKLQIGRDRTRGLGAGGDPEVGADAALEAQAELTEAMEGAEVVVLLAGLGGGTGSGALPVVAEAARARQAQVIVVATLPFGFEGKRRREQALEALASADAQADLLICFENDRMGEIASARAGIQEAFALVDQTLAQAVRSLAALLQGRGLLHVGLDEMCAAFADEHARALFGWGEAQGDNRARAAVEAALRCPLLDRGRPLREAAAVVIHLSGSADLTLQEAQIALEEMRKQVPDEIPLFCGLAVNPASASSLRVTILASTTAELPLTPPLEAAPAPARSVAPKARVAPPRTQPVRALQHEPLEITVELPASMPESAPADVPEELAPAAEEVEVSTGELEPHAEEPVETPAPAIRPRMRPLFAPMQNNLRRGAEPAALPGTPKAREERQEQMQFETVHRGRFEKSEPTIVDGQNLDVPTFMRRNLPR